MTKTAAKTEKSKKQEALDYAAKRTAALKEADAKLAEAFAKAIEARDKVYAEWPDANNFAEIAWNNTKVDEDPLYKDVASPFRAKLDDAAATIRTTGNADIVGLEDFEVEVKRLLEESEIPVGSQNLSPVTAPSTAAPAVKSTIKEK